MRLADTARPVPEQQMESRQGSPRYPKVKYLQLWKNELEPNPFKLLQRRYPIKQIQYSAKTINGTFFKVCLSWHDFLYCFCKIERNTQIRKHRPQKSISMQGFGKPGVLHKFPIVCPVMKVRNLWKFAYQQQQLTEQTGDKRVQGSPSGGDSFKQSTGGAEEHTVRAVKTASLTLN